MSDENCNDVIKFYLYHSSTSGNGCRCIYVWLSDKNDLTTAATSFRCTFKLIKAQDESKAHRYLKSPRSLSGRSLRIASVTKSHGHSHKWPTMSIGLTIPEIQLLNIWPWKSKVKVMPKVKSDGYIWGLMFNRYANISFRGNCIIFGWDTSNSIFDLEYSRTRSWQSWIPMVTFDA